VADIFGDAGVDIKGFSVCDTADSGILRLIVDDPARGRVALAAAGFRVDESDVICLGMPDLPGEFESAVRLVSGAGVNIESVYSLISPHVVIGVADVDRTASMLQGKALRLMTQEEMAQV
jgi:hypothetical protein